MQEMQGVVKLVLLLVQCYDESLKFASELLVLELMTVLLGHLVGE